MVEDDTLELTIRRLKDNAGLSLSECQAITGLLQKVETVAASDYIVRPGAPCGRGLILLEGFAFGQIGCGHSQRQIVGFHLAGDFLDLHGALTGTSKEAVIAATQCTVASFDAEAMIGLIERNPRVGRALWIETLVEASIAHEWILNVGQRTARQRLAHVCCELAWRTRAAGLGDGQTFSMPVTHEHLAAATGLARLHVSHALGKLEADGLLVRGGQVVRIVDEDRLREEAEFDEHYLRRDPAR